MENRLWVTVEMITLPHTIGDTEAPGSHPCTVNPHASWQRTGTNANNITTGCSHSSDCASAVWAPTSNLPTMTHLSALTTHISDQDRAEKDQHGLVVTASLDLPIFSDASSESNPSGDGNYPAANIDMTEQAPPPPQEEFRMVKRDPKGKHVTSKSDPQVALKITNHSPLRPTGQWTCQLVVCALFL